MQIRHVIWDWNGTLVNDASLCVEIVNDLLKEYSLNQVDLNYYRNNFKFPVSAYYKKLGLPYEGIEYEKIARKFISQYRELSHKCNLQPFARKTINRIFNLEINQSVLSASKTEDLVNFISNYGLSKYFVSVDGVSNIYACGKFDVADYHFRKLNRNKKEILIVGDTHHDHEIAKKLGIGCMLYSKGHCSCSSLNALNVKKTNDLRTVVDRLIS